MIECNNCGLIINKNDKKCPRCGQVFDLNKKKKNVLTGVGAGVLGAGIVGTSIASHEKDNKTEIKNAENVENIENNITIEDTEKTEQVDTIVIDENKDFAEENIQNDNQIENNVYDAAYVSGKYNDSLEINKTQSNFQKKPSQKIEDSKKNNTAQENSTPSSDEKLTSENQNENTLEKVEEDKKETKEENNSEEKLEEDKKENNNEEKENQKENDTQYTTDDDYSNNYEDNISTASYSGGDSSYSGGGGSYGDSFNINITSLEQALSILGCESLSPVDGTFSSCDTFGPKGGMSNLFDKIASDDFDKLNSTVNCKEKVSNFNSFKSSMEGELLNLRQQLLEMSEEGEEGYNLEYYKGYWELMYDENGNIDEAQARRYEFLWNALNPNDKKSIDNMTAEQKKDFFDTYYTNDNIQDYFQDFSEDLANNRNINMLNISSANYTKTDLYLRQKEEGIILTEQEVVKHYEDFADKISLCLVNSSELGVINLERRYSREKTLNNFVLNSVNDGAYGKDIDENGNPIGDDKPDYNTKTDEQKQLEIMVYGAYAENTNLQSLKQYEKFSAYIDDYCQIKNIENEDLSTEDHLYKLLKAGAIAATWDENGNLIVRTDEQTKIAQRYENVINGGTDGHRDEEWRINRDTFEETFILTDKHIEARDELDKIIDEHTNWLTVDSETNEIICDKEISELSKEEQEVYEKAQTVAYNYKVTLDGIALFNALVNPTLINEAKEQYKEEYNSEYYPEGLKEYLNYINDKNKNPYQYMAKCDVDNYSDIYEKYGKTCGSKIPQIIAIFEEMPEVKAGRVTAEELAENLSTTLSTNVDNYKELINAVEQQHLNNLGTILALTQDRIEDNETAYVNEGAYVVTVEQSDELNSKYDSIIQEQKDAGTQVAQEIGDAQTRLNKLTYEIDTVKNNKYMAIPESERTPDQKKFCMRYTATYGIDAEQQEEYNKQLTELYDRLSNCKNFDEAITLLNNITYTNNSKNDNLNQILDSKLLRGEPNFEEKSKSQISEIKVETIYLGEYGSSTIVAYDESGNKIDVSDEELELHIARIAKDNGGKIPFTYRTLLSSNQIKKINYLVENDLDVLTYKLHTENIEEFKEDYKHYIEYGALLQATDEYERYVDKLEQRGDFGDWITTVGYGARAGFEQFADGVSSFLNPDGIKSASEYRSMLISSYLLQEYGSDALNSNLMLGSYEISTSMANMMPSVLLSLIPGVGQTLSTAAMFISSAGNAMEQAYQSGATLNQSYVIGLISGALETGLQKTVGGITKLRIKGSVPLGFFNFSEKALAKVAEGSIKYALINYGFNILGEGLEEGTQEFLGPIVENIVKYGIDYTDDFKEWKDYINEMTLEEWQEAKFLEWKAETLSNNTSISTFFTMKDMTLEEWIKACENGEITDIEGNIIKANQNEFNRLKSDNYTAKDWFNDNKSSADVQSIIKSALYGAISGGIFEGITQFAPEVISYATTGTTVGVNAIMNAVRNQATQSGESTNLFRNFVETVQIIKDQSNTGKLSDLVAQYIQTPGFQTEYENFINENQNESSNSTDSKIIESLKSIKEKLFGPEENISEVDFATMVKADDLARNSLKNRLIKELNTTTYQSYQELTSKLDSVNKSIDEVSKELENLKSSEQLSDLYSELIKNKEEQLKVFEEQKANIEQTIKNHLKQTEGLQSELLSIREELNKNNDEAKTSISQYEQILNTETEESKRARELQNRIDGLTRALDNKIQKGEITETGIKNAQKQINDIKSELSKLKKNAEQSKTNLRETIQKLIIEIALNNIQIEEIQSILDILSNPGFNLSSLTVEQFNNFISNLDLNSLQVYAKDIVSRLSDLSDARISELIEKLDPITLGVFENQVVERVKHITEEEVLNNIKDKNASKFTQNIYKIEVSSDTTTNTTETVVTETRTETVSENTAETESNTRDNNSSVRETINSENETSTPEAKKELVSQNAALGTIGLIQMGALIGGPKGNQTLNNVLETIQTDINSLQQKYESTTINGEVNAETEVNVNGETNSNINVREELKSQIEQKTKLYNDLTQLMSKYGVDGTELLTTLKEEIVSEKYKLEHQLLNTETNIEETIIDSIRESEAAIKEIMQQFDLTKVDQTTLNEARTAAMYKILEIANKNNISVDSILSKINIDKMLVRNDAKNEIEIAANRLNGIVEETDNLTEEDFKFLESEDAQGAKDYIVLMKAIKNIRNLNFNMEDAQVIEEIYNRIKNQSPEFVREDKMKCVTLYIAKLKMKMYKNNLLGTVNIKDGTKTIKVNIYGKDISSNLLINSLNEINKLLKETPSFMKETITEINLFDFDCDLDLFFALKYYDNIAEPYQASASSNGSEISFWKLGLSQLVSEIPSEYAQGVRTLNHEMGHNIDKKLGECELSQDYWTFKNQLWNEAIERDGGRNYAPTEYAKTTLQEDFAESIAEYMSDPSYFTEKFPNRAKILQNIFKAYTKEIDCSYNKAVKRVNKQRLKEKLLYEKEVFECRKALDKMVKKTDLNNTRPDVLKSIQELLYGQALDIAQKYNMNIEEVLERINYYKIFPKNNITVPEIITIAPLGRNALDFDGDINGNTKNNVETRNTTEGVETIESLEQISDETIKNKLKEVIEKNQESNKKLIEGKISDAIAELSWSEINKILESSNNTNVIDELCQIWSTKQIGPIMSKFNYEQTVKIVNELKNGISTETLNDLNIERINNGMTIEEIYIERAHNIINSINPKYSEVSISNEFARAIVRNSQQLIKYKENSSYQNRYVENLLKFSPEQLNEINNLFNTISEYEFTQTKISDTQIAELGKIILDSIYDINSLGEQNIKLNMWAINGILKAAPTLTKNISEYNGMITSLISNYFFHNGEYIFIRNQEQLNLYGKDILYGLYGHEVNISDIIKIDGSKIIIDSEFKNIIKNKLNNYETRILYNYLEASIKESLINNQKNLNNKLYKLNNEIGAQQTEELNQVIESIRNNARLASSFRTELRFILQNAGFGISVLPKQGTNLLNATYEGAVINRYISETLKSPKGFLEVQYLLSDIIDKTSLEIDKNAFQEKLDKADAKGIRIILNELAQFDSNLISNLYKKLIVFKGRNFIINYEQGVFEGAFRSNEFVNLTLGITNVEESIFNERIKSWEEKIEGNHSLKDYDLLDKYTYWKYVKEVYDKYSEKVITNINWPELGGYLGIPKKLLDFIESNFEGQETLYISRLGGKNGTNVSLTSKSSTETLFGKLKDGSFARAIPYLFGENLMEGKINIAKYRTLCDCLYEYLFEQSTNKTINDTSALIKKLKENNINVDETKVGELIKAYERTYNKSATLKDFRIINKDFIKRFIENGQSLEEFNNLIKETSLENQNKINSMMEKYILTKDERILDDIISILGPEFRMNFDLRYGIGGTIASFVDLPGGGTQATLMFAYGLLEECGIIEGTQSGILTSEGSYLLPIELTENVDENSIKKLKKSIYELMKLKNSSNNLEIEVKYLEIDIAIENIIKELKTTGKYTQNIEETIEAFKKTMDFNKFINETSKMTNIIEYIGNLSIPEIDALIKNETYIFDLGETGNFVKIAMNIYNRGLESASTKYKDFYKNFRDHGFKHALEVTKYAIELAQKLNLTEAEIELVAYSSLAHDFGMQGGKVYIDDALLNKFTKYYIKYLKEIPNAELMNRYKEMFKNKLITESKNGRVWDIDGLKEYLKNEFGNFISNEKYIMDVARSSHPLNSALDILANSNMIPSTLQESIAKIFGEENSKSVATSLIALLAMSHSKSTSGIKLMNQSKMWLNCIEKLELSAKARGVDENLNVEALNRIIENPVLFEKLQDMAILVRDGDAMSKVVSEDGTTKTVMQNGENAILDLSNVRGEKLFNEDGKLITESEEQSRIIETTTSGRVIDNNFSKGIHAGELNTEYDSKYSKENGNKKYNATVRVKDSSLAPHSTLSNSILERLGELNTYTNMDERTFTIYLSAETDQRIIDLYNKVIEDWKTNAKNTTESSLSSIGIQPGTPQYDEIMAKQQAFYDNIQIKYE